MTGQARRDGLRYVACISGVAALAAQIGAAAAPHRSDDRPGTAIEYRIEARTDGVDIARRFTGPQLAILEKLNRADSAHLATLASLVVPAVWLDELRYSPFPLAYPVATQRSKVVIVDLPSQSFAAYERGRLVRWGPISSGGRRSPTPSGVFHLTWRSAGRHSTVNPSWYLKWYFNLDNLRGIAFHSYALPGYPASHGCIRLLERDAIWLYYWGETWTLDKKGRTVRQGTPVVVAGNYAFGVLSPWPSLPRPAPSIRLLDIPE